MSKGAKTFIYILLGLIALLIIYVIYVSKKQPSPKSTNKPNTVPAENTTTDIKTTDASKAGVDTTVLPNDANTAPVVLGNKVYAGQDILNLYTSCQPSQSNIWGTFSKGDFLGDFISNKDNCIKLASKNYLNTPFGSIPVGAIDTFVPFNAKIYFK